MIEYKKKSITVDELLDRLDGSGLIVTDPSAILATLGDMEMTFDTSIEFTPDHYQFVTTVTISNRSEQVERLRSEQAITI